MDAMRRIHSLRKDQLGEVFIQYLEPFTLSHELDAHSLTKRLQKLHFDAQKTTLSSLVALTLAAHLREEQKTLKTSELLTVTRQLYSLVKDQSFMQVLP
jgi:hypothetical protein